MIDKLDTFGQCKWFMMTFSSSLSYRTLSIFRPTITHCIVRQRCGQHTVTFSKSASEEVGDRGLMGLREGELPTLETYSGSGTYKTCKHNTCLCLHRHCLCTDTHAHHKYRYMPKGRSGRISVHNFLKVTKITKTA